MREGNIHAVGDNYTFHPKSIFLTVQGTFFVNPSVLCKSVLQDLSWPLSSRALRHLRAKCRLFGFISSFFAAVTVGWLSHHNHIKDGSPVTSLVQCGSLSKNPKKPISVAMDNESDAAIHSLSMVE